MKKFIYVLGIILINILLIGAIFKINHWPGAGVLLSLSMTLLVIGFFPLALIASYRSTSDKSQLHLYIIAYITVAFVIIGMLFKIMHWPGAGDMLIIGLILPFILFLPFYIRFHNKTKAKSDRSFFGIIFFMMYVAIISSLLAVGVSPDVYGAIESQIKKSVLQSNSLEQRNNHSYEVLIQNPKNESELVFIETLHTNADNLCNILESFKRELIIAANEKNKAVLTGKEINYDNISGGDKKDNTVSFISQKGDNTKENLIESRLIDFENAINDLSDKYDLSEILNPKDAPYSLAVIKNNLNEIEFHSRSMVENISALSFMQNRVRFLEYQILYKIQN